MRVVNHNRQNARHGVTLSEERGAFTADVAALIFEANSRVGWMCALDETKRPPAVAVAYAKAGKGIRASKHCDGLAADLLLYIDGVYQDRTQAYAPLGTWWKARRPQNRWGGDFHDAKGAPKPDGNHFERVPQST
jgi:hypothetical protein